MGPYFQIQEAAESDGLLLHPLRILANLLHLPLHLLDLHLPVPFLHHPPLPVLLSLLHLLNHHLLGLHPLDHHPLDRHLPDRHPLDHHPLGHHPLVHHFLGHHSLDPHHRLKYHPLTSTFDLSYSIITIASMHIIIDTILHLTHRLLLLHLIVITDRYFLRMHTVLLELLLETDRFLGRFVAHQSLDIDIGLFSSFVIPFAGFVTFAFGSVSPS